MPHSLLKYQTREPRYRQRSLLYSSVPCLHLYSMPDESPYEPIKLTGDVRASGFRFRVVPAVVLGLIGTTALAWGFFGLIVVMSIVLRDYDSSIPVSQPISDVAIMLIACVVFLGVGFFTLAAGWSVWQEKYWRAIWSSGIVALLIAIVAIVDATWR